MQDREKNTQQSTAIQISYAWEKGVLAAAETEEETLCPVPDLVESIGKRFRH